MSRIFAALGLALAVASLAAPAASADPLDGVVTGSVVNKTADGASPAGDMAHLLVFGVKEQAQIDEKTAHVGGDGRFSFTGLDRDPNRAFFVVVEHQGVQYSNPDPFQLRDQATHRADVEVYDATSSDASIQLDRTNLLVVGMQPGLLQVMQMGTVSNAGDRTYLPERRDGGVLARGLRLSLPRGTVGAQVQAGFDPDSVVASTDGIQVISPIRPGKQQFAMSFQVPFNGSAADLDLRFNYPTAGFSLYLPDGPQLSGGSLQGQGTTTLGGQQYALFGASNLARDTVITMHVSGLPSTGGTGLGGNQIAAISAGTVLLVLGAGSLLFSGRSQRSAGAATGSGPRLDHRGSLEQERLELVVRMAALDERYAAGSVPEAEYRAERERGKTRLVELTQALRQSEAPA